MIFLAYLGSGASFNSLPPEAQDLALKDFQPRPTLVTQVTKIRRARFPVIDVHGHLGFTDEDLGGVQPGQMVRLMDELNIRTIVNLTGTSGFPGVDPRGSASRPTRVAGIEESLRRWDRRFSG